MLNAHIVNKQKANNEKTAPQWLLARVLGHNGRDSKFQVLRDV